MILAIGAASRDTEKEHPSKTPLSMDVRFIASVTPAPSVRHFHRPGADRRPSGGSCHPHPQ
jgi:hypothetical protein